MQKHTIRNATDLLMKSARQMSLPRAGNVERARAQAIIVGKVIQASVHELKAFAAAGIKPTKAQLERF